MVRPSCGGRTKRGPIVLQKRIERSGVARLALRVRLVDPTADPRWAAFVTGHPEGSVFHHPGWSQTLADSYGYRPAHLACEAADGTLQGVLPLFYRRGLLRGRALWSLPHTPLAGPLATSTTAAAALVRAAVDMAEREGGYQVQFKTLRDDLASSVAELNRREWHPTYILVLPERSKPLRLGSSRAQRDIRRCVKKAQAHGLRVREAERLDDLRAWYRLYLSTMREKASPPHPLRFFEAAWHYLVPDGVLRLLLVERHEAGRTELVGGGLVFIMPERAVGEYIGRRADAARYHFHDLFQWEAIHAAWMAGCRSFDLGNATARQEGLARYKLKWGGRPRPVYRYSFPTGNSATLASPNASLTRARSPWERTVWQRVPLGLTAHLGGWLNQHI